MAALNTLPLELNIYWVSQNINAEGSTDKKKNLTFIFWKGFLSVLYVSAHFTIVTDLKYQVYIVAIFKIVIKLEHKTRKKQNSILQTVQQVPYTALSKTPQFLPRV